jgi:hypothetical protein
VTNEHSSAPPEKVPSTPLAIGSEYVRVKRGGHVGRVAFRGPILVHVNLGSGELHGFLPRELSAHP